MTGTLARTRYWQGRSERTPALQLVIVARLVLAVIAHRSWCRPFLQGPNPSPYSDQRLCSILGHRSVSYESRDDKKQYSKCAGENNARKQIAAEDRTHGNGDLDRE